MSRLVRLLAAALLIALFAGCVPKGTAFAPLAPQGDKALIYVYRETAFVNSAETMLVSVNGNEIGPLWHSSYIYTFADPGDVTVVLNKNVWPNNEYGRITIPATQPGGVYYIKCDPVPFGGFNMNNVAESQAMPEISRTKYFPPQ